MSYLKRTLHTSFLALITASFAPLMAMPNITGKQVTLWPGNALYVSNPTHAYDVECRALFLKPSGNLLHYAAEAEPLPLTSPSWKIHDVKTDYHPGFELSIRAMAYNSTHMKLAWQHLQCQDTSTRTVGTNDMIGPLFEIGPDALLYTSARGKATFLYDSVTLDGGLFINIGENLTSNIYAGVNGTRIKQTIFTKFSNANGTVTRTIDCPSTFVGVGPQLGVDLGYKFCDGFSVTANGAISLLVGSLRNHTSFNSVTPALIPLGIKPPNAQSTHLHHRMQVVPALEGKLGLAYNFEAFNWAFSLEAGYEAKIYINAVQTSDIGSEVLTPPVLPDTIGVFARTFQRQVSNFALAGPYISLNVAF